MQQKWSAAVTPGMCPTWCRAAPRAGGGAEVEGLNSSSMAADSCTSGHTAVTMRAAIATDARGSAQCQCRCFTAPRHPAT